MTNMLAGSGNARAKWVMHYALILVGCLIGAVAYPLFLVPNGIAPGGVTGISMVLHHAFGWPVGMTSLLINIPLFLIGYRSMGRTLFMTDQYVFERRVVQSIINGYGLPPRIAKHNFNSLGLQTTQ